MFLLHGHHRLEILVVDGMPDLVGHCDSCHGRRSQISLTIGRVFFEGFDILARNPNSQDAAF